MNKAQLIRFAKYGTHEMSGGVVLDFSVLGEERTPPGQPTAETGLEVSTLELDVGMTGAQARNSEEVLL